MSAYANGNTKRPSREIPRWARRHGPLIGVATLDDYAQVRDLVGTLVAEGAETTVRQEVRAVVHAVAQLLSDNVTEVRQSDLARVLRLDKSVISRRVASAIELGVLRNREDRKGRPAQLALGEPIPDDVEILPSPERLHGCPVDEGDARPPPGGRQSRLTASRHDRGNSRSP